MIVGFTNGCFDLFHPGHDHYLRECKKACNYLIVAVNSDAYCRQVKGPDRPVWNWRRRMQYVRTIASAVIPFERYWSQMIPELNPHVIFQGEEYRNHWGPAVGAIPVIYIPRLPGYSTSSEAARLRERPEEVKTAPP